MSGTTNDLTRERLKGTLLPLSLRVAPCPQLPASRPPSFAMSDNVVLIAPRPLRVASLTAQRPGYSVSTRMVSPTPDTQVFSRMKFGDSEEIMEDISRPPSGRASASPR